MNGSFLFSKVAFWTNKCAALFPHSHYWFSERLFKGWETSCWVSFFAYNFGLEISSQRKLAYSTVVIFVVDPPTEQQLIRPLIISWFFYLIYGQSVENRPKNKNRLRESNKTGVPRPLKGLPSPLRPCPPAELAPGWVLRTLCTLAVSHRPCSHQMLRTGPASNAMSPRCSFYPVVPGVSRQYVEWFVLLSFRHPMRIARRSVSSWYARGLHLP